MYNILIINSFYYPNIRGGAEIICQQQAELLKERGYNVFVLTTDEKGKGLKESLVNGIKVYRIGIYNKYWHFEKVSSSSFKKLQWHIMDIYNPFMNKYLSSILKLKKIDIVLCHNLSGFSISVWSTIKANKIPIIQILHDQYLLCTQVNAFKNGQICQRQCLQCKLFRIPHKTLSKNIDAVVGVSHYILNRFTKLNYFMHSKKFVIHNEAPLKKIYKLPWNQIRPIKFGFIGTISEVKGINVLINAFNDLNDDTELIIAGKAESLSLQQRFESLIKNNQKITYLGYVPATEFYSIIDVLIIPSIWPDTFPTVALEAVLNFIPVIASNVGGLPEIIKHNENGVLIESNNINALKNAMDTFIAKDSIYPHLLKKIIKSNTEMKPILPVINQYESIITKLLS